MPEEEKQNGIESRLDDLTAQDSLSVIMGSDRFGHEECRQLVIPDAAITTSAAILSTGAVAALFYFAYLCVLHPDAANVLLAVLGWTVPKLMEFWKKRREKKRDG